MSHSFYENIQNAVMKYLEDKEGWIDLHDESIYSLDGDSNMISIEETLMFLSKYTIESITDDLVSLMLSNEPNCYRKMAAKALNVGRFTPKIPRYILKTDKEQDYFLIFNSQFHQLRSRGEKSLQSLMEIVRHEFTKYDFEVYWWQDVIFFAYHAIPLLLEYDKPEVIEFFDEISPFFSKYGKLGHAFDFQVVVYEIFEEASRKQLLAINNVVWKFLRSEDDLVRGIGTICMQYTKHEEAIDDLIEYCLEDEVTSLNAALSLINIGSKSIVERLLDGRLGHKDDHSDFWYILYHDFIDRRKEGHSFPLLKNISIEEMELLQKKDLNISRFSIPALEKMIEWKKEGY
ncbi:MAG: hypothetical protein GOP50_02675 [Candidatus Heimdallarchaeota archaeon]|nr:hypothetical protein [Candidatus Heimdallarchaeota archaeon]